MHLQANHVKSARAAVRGSPMEEHAGLHYQPGHNAPDSSQSLRVEESSIADLAAGLKSLKYMPGVAAGGAASMANVVFGVSIIGLLAFQATRSTVAKCLPPRKMELVPSPLLASEKPSQSDCDHQDI